ncbi:MAG: cytidine deaminase, partial [Planctomycetota bacterium]
MSESIAQRPGLDPMDQALLQAAHDVRLCAYAPYSKFRVGAAVRTELGVFTGVNVENASYPLTVCAERNAIATAIAAGARHVEAVAVAAETEGPASPCGACRQVISEHGPGADLILASTFGPYMKTTIDQLLPHAFGPTDVPGYDAAFGAPPAEPSEHTAVPHVQGGEAQDALPLAGLKILDLTRILAGPFATQRLADLGATVWKIENPKGGDDTRGWGPPFHGGISTYFLSVNRNKRSVAIDLKHEAGKALLWQLIEQADVLVENFRPGTLGRLGFGWDEVSRRSPRLIYCSVSGYGHQSAYRARPSYDVVVQGESGVMDLTGDPEGPPTKCGLSIADLVAGMNAVQGILAAVHRRHLTGRGGRVDIALFDGMLAMLAYQGQMQLSVGKRPMRMGNAHPSIVPYETFRTEDGHINLGVASESLWARFCDTVGHPGWRDDERFARNQDRVVHRAELRPLVEAALMQDTTESWHARLSEAGVPCGRVNSVPEALQLAIDDPARGLIVELDHPIAGKLPMVG